MATKTWNGSNGAFSDGTQWSPAGVPAPGDIAIISTGTVLASGLTLAGLTINLSSNASVGGTLTLANDIIASNSTLVAANTNAYGSGVNTYLDVQGTTTNFGTMTFTGSITTMRFSNGAASGTLVNRGTINVIDASPFMIALTGSATPILENDSVISFTNPDRVYQSPVIGANVTGTGTINVGANGKVDFSQGVGAGQTLSFTGGVGASSVVQIDQPSTFNATVTGFVQGDTITVTNTPYTNYTYTTTGASSGTLNLFNGSALQGSIKLSGIYSASAVSLSYQPLSGTSSNLVITTTVVNPATGALSNGGNASTLPMYRFFDKIYGTHLFTADAGEVANIKATRSDLAEEVNGFGSVAQGDPNAVSVYRFFNLNDGTHFYTANQAEFLGLTTRGTATYRSDLSYEPNSTLYEHVTQQAGDVAVYRLFDSVRGTQFLTGDQGEYNNITTAGLSTYRPDLRPEGVAFYSPTGSFFL